ncbi:MAG TPA: hypothetical protein VL689_10895 [Paraburkholderia sp.]|jgi:hypothetical protein|nr:hypothetical protein [Paraburkholderia sp.]
MYFGLLVSLQPRQLSQPFSPSDAGFASRGASPAGFWRRLITRVFAA